MIHINWKEIQETFASRSRYGVARMVDICPRVRPLSVATIRKLVKHAFEGIKLGSEENKMFERVGEAIVAVGIVVGGCFGRESEISIH